MITIIDYGVGNINAFVNVYNRLDIPTRIANSAADLENVQKLILPGVGHFDHAMLELLNSGMLQKLNELVLFKKIPVLGICVGMQLMANSSEEGTQQGLGWIDASVKKFDEAKIDLVTRLPHMGWNDVIPAVSNPLFNGLEQESLFYFLHSYFFDCNDKNNVLATTDYGDTFTSAAYSQNIYGVQFHPEKSHKFGEKLLHNFAKL
jgi:glutamine amidotransferase